MPGPFCQCQCKMCRIPGSALHCHGHPSCGAPAAQNKVSRQQPVSPKIQPRWDVSPGNAINPSRPDAQHVISVLDRLKSEAGSHSPSVTQLEQALPGLVRIDACFLANPYATDEVMARLRAIPASSLERMISHYPSQSRVMANVLAPHLGVPAQNLHLANGACEVIHALLAGRTGPLLISVPTFSAYYEAARGPVLKYRLDHRNHFRLNLDVLESLVIRHSPETVVIINPNNPDGGSVPHADLTRFIERLDGKVEQIIVDESFSHFAGMTPPETVAPMVAEFPHLVVVNSLSKNYGIAGLRLGYAVMSTDRVSALRRSSLWNINAFAEWFCTSVLTDPCFQHAYELARRRYVADARRLFTDLGKLPGVTVFPSAANFVLLRLDRPAREVTAALLADHGIYVRDCGDKQGLDGDSFIRVAARTEVENRRIVDGLREVLHRTAASATSFTQPLPRGIESAAAVS